MSVKTLPETAGADRKLVIKFRELGCKLPRTIA